MSLKDIPDEPVLKTGWTDWIEPVMKNYLLACCDCGLVHRIDFRLKDGEIQMRLKRAPRYTAVRRKQPQAKK